MTLLGAGEAMLGGALLFFVPGFTVARAVFPELRFRGPGGLRDALELVALSFVLSVVLTVLVGTVLLATRPGGFSASWSDPLLETVLAAVAAVGFVAGIVQGGYSRTPPGRATPTVEPGGEGAWELSLTIDRLRREASRIERELRRAGSGPAPEELRRRLRELQAEQLRLGREREAEYDR